MRMRNVFSALALIGLASCNFADLPPAEQALNSSLTASSQCTVDSKEMDKFLESDINTSLSCIEAKLKLYASVDQRVDPDYLDLNELTRFMNTFMKDPLDLEQGVVTLFQVNELIFNGQKNKIEVVKLKQLFDFLRSINLLVIPVYKNLSMLTEEGDILEGDYDSHRANGLAALKQLSDYIGQTLSENPNQRPLWIIDEVLSAATTEKNKKFIDDIRSLKFLKVLIAGGDPDTITFDEVLQTFKKLSGLGEVAFDIMAGARTQFANDLTYLNLLHDKVNQVRSLLFHQAGDNEKYFHYKSLITASTHYADLLMDLAPIEDSVYEFKNSQILGDESDYFTYKNIDQTLKYAEDVLFKLNYFQRMWELNESVLKTAEAVDDSKLKDTLNMTPREITLNKEFKKIIKTYRYFRGDTLVPLYDNAYRRNFKGLGEIAVLEYVVKLFMKAYGIEKRDDKITEKDFLSVVMRYDDFVTEMKLWKNPVSGMVKTNYLMMDYFRNNSNNNGYIDLSEGIEYILMELTSFHIADNFYPELEQDCVDSPGCDLSVYPGGVPTKFFYQNFFKHFLTYRADFPNLYKYYLGLNEDQAFEYVRNMAKFARQCPYDYDAGINEIPIKLRDITLITGGIISLEETFLVLDLNKDNVLTYDELEIAVDRFKDAIAEFAKLDKSTAFLARTIFYYLVIKQELPTPAQALLYHVNFNLFVNKKKIAADRGALAGLLKNFNTPLPVPDADCFVDKPEPNPKPE